MIHRVRRSEIDWITHQNRILFRVLRKLQRGDPSLYLSSLINDLLRSSGKNGRWLWENIRCPLESILAVESIAITHWIYFCFEKQTGKNSRIDDLDFQFLSWTQSRILANFVFEWLDFESARSKVLKTHFAVTLEVSWHPQESPRSRKSVEPKSR